MRYEAQQFLTVQGLVRVGLGVGIVPPDRGGAPSCAAISALLPITDPALTREVGMITQRGRPLSPIAIAFEPDAARDARGRSRPAHACGPFATAPERSS